MKVLSVSVPLPGPGDPNTMAPLARQHDALRAIGVDVRALEIRGVSKVKYLTSLRQLHREVDRVDLVHAHYGYAGWLGRLQRTKPLVVSFMGTDLLGVPVESGGITKMSAAVVQADRWFARLADVVIVKSEQMAEIVKPVPSHVIPNGVDLDEFAPRSKKAARAKLGWVDNATKVLFPGDPSNLRKGYSLARAAVDRLIETTGHSVDLIALHEVDASLVPTYMNACDVMIMASIFEGSPNVVKEAMACDLPTVSVRVGDVGSLFDSVESGYTIVDRDANAMADALRETLCSDVTVTGRDALIAKGLGAEQVAQRILDVYERALSA